MGKLNSNEAVKVEPRVVNNLLNLIIDKQRQEGRLLNETTIADEAGISRITVKRWLNGQISDYSVELKLCLYFGVDIGDLLHIERDAPDTSDNGGGPRPIME